MIRAPWSRDRIRIRVYTVPPPPAPDLLAESARQAALAKGLAGVLLTQTGTAAAWPDPYGPDRLVFGPGPR